MRHRIVPHHIVPHFCSMVLWFVFRIHDTFPLILPLSTSLIMFSPSSSTLIPRNSLHSLFLLYLRFWVYLHLFVFQNSSSPLFPSPLLIPFLTSDLPLTTSIFLTSPPSHVYFLCLPAFASHCLHTQVRMRNYITNICLVVGSLFWSTLVTSVNQFSSHANLPQVLCLYVYEYEYTRIACVALISCMMVVKCEQHTHYSSYS